MRANSVALHTPHPGSHQPRWARRHLGRAAAGIVFQANLARHGFHLVVQSIAAMREFAVSIEIFIGHVLGRAPMLGKQGVNFFIQGLILQHETTILLYPLHIIRSATAGLGLVRHERVSFLRSEGGGPSAAIWAFSFSSGGESSPRRAADPPDVSQTSATT